MTRDNALPPSSLRAIKPREAAAGRPVVVGRIGTFSAANGLEFAGRSVLNVVWHLHSLGFEPLLITRIGNDAEGRQAMRLLANSGVDLGGVQVDDSLPTSGNAAPSDAAEGPRSAWEALDSKAAVSTMRQANPALLFHGATAIESELIRKNLTTIQTQTGTPHFIDLDLDTRDPPKRWVRRALLGVKWIRADAGCLADLIGDSETTVSRSIVDLALTVKTRFALDGVIVEHKGFPIFGVHGNNEGRSTVSPPNDQSFLPGGRDASAAVLIVGLLLGWSGKTLFDRAAQFAYLAGKTTLAQRVDGFIYASVLRHWSAAKTNSVG